MSNRERQIKGGGPKAEQSDLETEPDIAPRTTAGALLKLQRSVGNQAVHNLLRAARLKSKLTVAPQESESERRADAIADHIVHGPGGRLPGELVAPQTHDSRQDPPSGLEGEEGRPLNTTTRALAEPAFDQDLGDIRLHDGTSAELLAEGLGARALTYGRDIWLGRGESEADTSLISHELAHASQDGGDNIYLRSATWLERRAWLAFFSHYLPRKLLNNYMDDTAAPIILTQQEMIDCNPMIDIRRSPGFVQEVARLSKSGGGTAVIAVSGWGGALTNGTLGNFTIHYSGTLVVAPSGDWTFLGTMDFFDFWDFDPKPFGSGSGRPTSAEVKVRVAATFLPGSPFNITSVKVPVTQASKFAQAWWAGGVPTAVAEPSKRTAADIEAGGAGGEAAGGPAGGEVGGETGAQSAEDLNR